MLLAAVSTGKSVEYGCATERFYASVPLVFPKRFGNCNFSVHHALHLLGHDDMSVECPKILQTRGCQGNADLGSQRLIHFCPHSLRTRKTLRQTGKLHQIGILSRGTDGREPRQALGCCSVRLAHD